jgi:hypothetical protein
MFNWLFQRECKICKALELQLEYERKVNQDLIETLSALLKPAPVIEQVIVNEQNPPVESKFQTWAKRRAALEAADRQAYEVMKNSKIAAKSDKELEASKETVEELEKEVLDNKENENISTNSSEVH